MPTLDPWGFSTQWRDGIPPEIFPGDAEVLTHLLNEVKRKGMVVVEVGSWVGNGSTRVIAETIRGAGILYCVDTWAGSDNVGHHQHYRQRYNTLFSVFADNVKSYGGRDMVRPLLLPSTEASRLFPDASVDLVFIDANHGHSHVKRDVLAWLPKVKPGGTICGHDCEVRYTDLSDELKSIIETRCEEDYYENETLPGPSAFHAGVVKAIHEIFGDRAVLWSKQKPSTIWSHRPGGLMGRVRAFLRERAPVLRGGAPRAWKFLPKATPWPAAAAEVEVEQEPVGPGCF